MAKVTFTKLGLKKNEDVKIVQICGQDIEVKQYLPIQEKLELISKIINESTETNNFENPVQIDVYTNFEILCAYTNIGFTEKQKEDITKTYDLLESNKVFVDVFAWIPKTEYDLIINGVKDSIKALYTYRNSALGIVESIKADYDNTQINLSKLQEQINDPNIASFIKELLPLMGQNN